MRYLSDVKTAAKLAVALIGSLGILASSSTYAQQSGAGTDVNVRICPQVSNSSLTITRPQSDSKTNQPKIVIEGDVEYISQIDFFVNDVYDHTIALGYSTTAFRSSLTVAPGTHTLKLEAVDTCSPEPLVEELVITYQPEARPSTGSDIVTDIPSFYNGTPPGGVIGIPLINLPGADDQTDDGSETPTAQPITGPDQTSSNQARDRARAQANGSNLDIGTILLDQRLDVWLRAFMVILGVILLFAPWRVLSVTDYIRQGLVDHVGHQVRLHAQHPHMRLAGRFVGAGLLLLAFLV